MATRGATGRRCRSAHRTTPVSDFSPETTPGSTPRTAHSGASVLISPLHSRAEWPWLPYSSIQRMVVSLSESDEGKDVVHDGETIGRVMEVRAGTAYVDPNPTLASSLRAKLGWGDGAADIDTYPLENHMIEQIRDDEISIKDETNR